MKDKDLFIDMYLLITSAYDEVSRHKAMQITIDRYNSFLEDHKDDQKAVEDALLNEAILLRLGQNLEYLR